MYPTKPQAQHILQLIKPASVKKCKIRNIYTRKNTTNKHHIVIFPKNTNPNPGSKQFELSECYLP